MKNLFQSLYSIISHSHRRVYYIGKKATFTFCLLTALAYFFPTTHNGDLVDIIWSHLYFIGPIMALVSLVLLFLAAYEEHKQSNKIN